MIAAGNESAMPETAEERVVEAVRAFHSDLCSGLTARAIHESSSNATVALQQLTELHSRTVEDLNDQIDRLQKQLFEAVEVIEKLGAQFARNEDEKSTDDQRSFTVDVLSISHGLETEVEVGQQNTEHACERGREYRPSREELSSDAFATAKSGSSLRDTGVMDDETADPSLLRDLWRGRRTLQQQQQQQTWLVDQIKDLTSLLEKVVKENAVYRRELKLLHATSVPLEEHKKLLEERDRLLHDCSSMRIELQRLHEEVEATFDSAHGAHRRQRDFVSSCATASSLSEYKGEGSFPLQMREPEGLVHSLTTPLEGGESNDPGAQFAGGCHSGFDDGALLHTGLWKTAMRELEQQAALAASQLSAAGRLRELDDRVAELTRELDELRASYKELAAEDKCVREDCEQLTFRNAVLSQQVASLLVRVERQCRSIHRLSRQHDEQKEEIETLSESEELTDRGRDVGKVRHRADRGRTAAAARALLERRSAVMGQSPLPSTPTAGRGTDCGVSHVLDVMLPQLEPLQVEGGLRSAVGVFARGPRRSVHLRNLGSPPVTLENTQPPRLPPCEELSGVALGRPSGYATVYPSQLKGQTGPSSVNSKGSFYSETSAASGLVVSEDEEENKRFVELLREDENLERFSINSVKDLLKRNQELLKQLYIMTQRADSVPKQTSSEVAAEEGEKSRSTSDTEAAVPLQRSNRKRRRESTSFSGEEVREQSGKLQRSCEEVGSPDQAVNDSYVQLERHVHEHIDAVLRSHEAQLTLTDKGLASSLIHVIELGREFNTSAGNKHFENWVDVTAKDNIITSLVRLCLQQGIRAADQAIALAAAQQSIDIPSMKDCWCEAQRVLKQSARELQSAVSQLQRDNPAITVVEGISSASVSASEKEADEAQLLQSITQLLRTASLREHTVQRVLRLAARRMRATRRACDVSKSAPLQPCEDTQEQCDQPARDKTNETHDVPFGDTDDDWDSDSDGDDGPRQLRLQVDAAHAQYQKLLAAHHEERKQHTVLLDRMWRLEEEMVAARRQREEALESMATMMKREDYEATVAALDNANATVEMLEERVKQQSAVQGLQQQELERCKQEREEDVRRHAEEAAQRAAQFAHKDEIIAHYASQQQQLEQRISDLQTANHQLEAQVQQGQCVINAKEEEVTELQKKLCRAELALLEQECTQGLLLTMFPGDEFLEKNSNLIHEQRREKEVLTQQVALLKVELDTARQDMTEQRLQLQQAVQMRQEAELLLQELALGHKRTVEDPLDASSTQTPCAAMASETYQAELESLRRANALLLVEKQGWEEREELLRRQLDALGRNPVSETARRYGLQGTQSFEEQLEQMQVRCAELQQKLEEAEALRITLKELTEEKVHLASQLDELQTVLSEQRETNKALEREIKKVHERLVEKEESHDAVKITLAEKEEMINNISDAIRSLEAQIKNLDRSVSETEKERDKLLQDNVKLIESVKALTEAVKKKEAERKAAQAALAQGLASASASSQRRRGRTSGGAGGPTPVSITGSLGLKPS